MSDQDVQVSFTDGFDHLIEGRPAVGLLLFAGGGAQDVATSARAIDRFARLSASRGCSHAMRFSVPDRNISGVVCMPLPTTSRRRGVRGWSCRTSTWPDPVGFRIEASDTGIEVQSDFLSLLPIFWGASQGGLEVVSTSLSWCAAATGSELDPIATSSLLLTSIPLGPRTVYDRVRRLPADSVLVIDQEGVVIRSAGRLDELTRAPRLDCVSREAIGRLDPLLDDMCRGSGGIALELTGGVDSRLNLALMLKGGRAPDFAFTIGPDESEDVQLAKLVAAKAGIPHLQIESVVRRGDSIGDARAYMEGAGYQVNVLSYGWMPALFDQLSDRRTIQCSGQAASTGHYYTPADWTWFLKATRRLWVRKRLVMSGSRVTRFASEELLVEADRHLLATCEAMIGTNARQFRAKSDVFYTTGRNHGWSGPVAAAACHWYDNRIPLLSESYVTWSWGSLGWQRAGKNNQRWLIEAIVPSLVDGVPFSNGKKATSRLAARLGLRPDAWKSTTRSVLRRLRGDRRAETGQDLAFLSELLDSAGMRESVQRVMASLDCSSPSTELKSLETQATSCIVELGLLLTLGMLQQAVDAACGDMGEQMVRPHLGEIQTSSSRTRD